MHLKSAFGRCIWQVYLASAFAGGKRDAMTEMEWERLLKIRTSGRDDTCSGQYYYRYEPTPYSVLERLAETGYISKKNTLLDYGCGKGRVSFFMSWQTRCRSIGIEYDERMCRCFEKNLNKAVSGTRVILHKMYAQEYVVPPSADRCYFFNPFSLEIFCEVLERIRESWYEYPRRILLFFYYPSDEYTAELMTSDDMMFVDEVDCRDLFAGNDPRERILIFELPKL